MAAAKPRDKIFVEDLPGDMEEQRIQEIFHAYGTVISVKASPPTPQGTRSAIIQMDNEEEASWFVDNVNGNKCQGLDNPVKISFHVEAAPPASKGLGKAPAAQGSTARTSPYGTTGTTGTTGLTSAAAAALGALRASPKGSAAGAFRPAASSPSPGVRPVASAAASPVAGFGGGSSSSTVGALMGSRTSVPAASVTSTAVPLAGVVRDHTPKTGAKLLVDGIIDSGELPGGASYENDANTLFVRGLPRDTTDLELYQIFAPFGAIAPRGCRAMKGADRKSCKGTGFVNFMSSKAAQDAILALNGTTMPGDRVLTITIKQEFAAPLAPAATAAGFGSPRSPGGAGGGVSQKGLGKGPRPVAPRTPLPVPMQSLAPA